MKVLTADVKKIIIILITNKQTGFSPEYAILLIMSLLKVMEAHEHLHKNFCAIKVKPSNAELRMHDKSG